MRVLVLGANGMLGHKIIQTLAKNHDVIGTVRKDKKSNLNISFRDVKIFVGFDALYPEKFFLCCDDLRPDVIINCIGIIKQLPESNDPILSILINSLFPQKIAMYCQDKTIRFIHYSTDCVFSGKKGNYTEKDYPDPPDLYGRSKLLGEVFTKNSLILRTSLIGREIDSKNSLLEWLLSQNNNKIIGFTNAIFSGLTTITHSEILEQIISKHQKLSGLYHLSSEPISKYDLLSKIISRFNLNIKIQPDESYICYRDLNCAKFKTETNINIPSWDEMVEQLYKDSKTYNIL